MRQKHECKQVTFFLFKRLTTLTQDSYILSFLKASASQRGREQGACALHPGWPSPQLRPRFLPLEWIPPGQRTPDCPTSREVTWYESSTQTWPMTTGCTNKILPFWNLNLQLWRESVSCLQKYIWEENQEQWSLIPSPEGPLERFIFISRLNLESFPFPNDSSHSSLEAVPSFLGDFPIPLFLPPSLPALPLPHPDSLLAHASLPELG